MLCFGAERPAAGHTHRAVPTARGTGTAPEPTVQNETPKSLILWAQALSRQTRLARFFLLLPDQQPALNPQGGILLAWGLPEQGRSGLQGHELHLG